MKKAIYPGTFDPITNGHIDIIDRASNLFDHLIVSVARVSDKSTTLFSYKERVSFIKSAVVAFPNVEVDSFDGLMVDHATKHCVQASVRGLRALSDFEFEFNMALMNRSIKDEITTVFLMSHEKYTHISSSMIREVASLGGDVSNYVPSQVSKALIKKYL